MTRTQRLTLIATILGTTIVFLDSTVVNVALPAIQKDLDTGLAGQQWVMEAYLLTLVAFMLVGGSMGDLYGRRRLFLIGLLGFAVTSVMCAIAPSAEFLIGARALQGIAGALLVPGSLAILAATFNGEARGRAVGLWTAWAGISTLLGPAAGGLLIELDWRWIFWLNLPLIGATLWLTKRAVSESSDPEACPGIDYVGIGLSAVGLGGPVFALIEQPTYGWGDPLVALPLVGGIACLVTFVWWEARTGAPMVPLGLFRSRNFSVVNLTTLCVYAGLYGGTLFLTLFLQQVAGYSPFEAGLASTPITIIMFLLSGRFGAIAARTGPRLVMGVGPLLGAAGLLMLMRLDSGGDYFGVVLPALIVFGVGLAMTVAPLTTTILNSVAERRAGVASGINNAVARIAGLLAIAAIGAVISAQFASSLNGRIADSRPLPPQQAEIVADAKEQPLAGDGAGVLPANAPAQLRADIVASSESGFRVGLLVAAAIMALGGAITLTSVRAPARREEEGATAVPATATAAAGECGHAADRDGEGIPEPVVASAPDPAQSTQ